MKLGSSDCPLRVAIIGAGPSGMYVADALFKSDISVDVTAFDRLPSPYGLLRGGVAPDHQKMKSVAGYYDRVANNEAFSFLGNVEIGKDIDMATLRQFYDVVVVTIGAASDRRLGIDGEDLDGSFAATEFVGWYNAHPDFEDRDFSLNNRKTVAVIGQGNVAIDVTRILAKTTEELATSDIPESVMAVLKESTVEDIYLIGRRGPVQAAFTQLEIKELGELADCDIIVDSDDLTLSDACQKELDDTPKSQKNMAVLDDFSMRTVSGKRKRIHVKFFRSPLSINGSAFVEAIRLGKTQLSGEAFSQRAQLSGDEEVLDCDMVLRSVGYRGVALPGLPFDEISGCIPHENGQVRDGDTLLDWAYVSGWIKRGPSGVLGSNKPDSTATVKQLLENLSKIPACSKRSNADVLDYLSRNKVAYITFEDWQKIDAIEKEAGEKLGKPREKFCNIPDMLAALK